MAVPAPQGRRIVAVLWVAALVYGELVSFHAALWVCEWRWPAVDVPMASMPAAAPVRVALVADPQLTDPYSYKHTGLLEWLVEYYCDVYQARAFYALQLYGAPDAVFFLGDLFDGGREWTDDRVWLAEMRRFQNIFRPRLARRWKSNRAMATYGDIPFIQPIAVPTHPEFALDGTLPYQRQTRGPAMFYLPGNHDVGVGRMIVDSAQRRYLSHFGPSSYAVQIGGVSFVALDMLELKFDTLGTLPDQHKRDMINDLQRRYDGVDVLMVHIPLFRSEQADCGPYRQVKPIKQHAGYQYVNMIDGRSTHTILTALRPKLVFSGDDHHPCTFRHNDNTTEYTVGTFSWMQGNLIPSFGMLTAQKTDNGTALAYDVCFLPNQLWQLFGYALLAAATVPLYAITCWAYILPRNEMDSTLPRPMGDLTYSSHIFCHLPWSRYAVVRRVPHRNDIRALLVLIGRLVMFYVGLHIISWMLVWTVAPGLSSGATADQ